MSPVDNNTSNLILHHQHGPEVLLSKVNVTRKQVQDHSVLVSIAPVNINADLFIFLFIWNPTTTSHDISSLTLSCLVSTYVDILKFSIAQKILCLRI